MISKDFIEIEKLYAEHRKILEEVRKCELKIEEIAHLKEIPRKIEKMHLIVKEDIEKLGLNSKLKGLATYLNQETAEISRSHTMILVEELNRIEKLIK